MSVLVPPGTTHRLGMPTTDTPPASELRMLEPDCLEWLPGEPEGGVQGLDTFEKVGAVRRGQVLIHRGLICPAELARLLTPCHLF